jgi:hypothetical protein
MTGYIILLDAFLLGLMLVYSLRGARLRDLVASVRILRAPRTRPRTPPATGDVAGAAPGAIGPALPAGPVPTTVSETPRSTDATPPRGEPPALPPVGSRVVPILIMVPIDKVEELLAARAKAAPDLPPPRRLTLSPLDALTSGRVQLQYPAGDGHGDQPRGGSRLKPAATGPGPASRPRAARQARLGAGNGRLRLVTRAAAASGPSAPTPSES